MISLMRAMCPAQDGHFPLIGSPKKHPHEHARTALALAAILQGITRGKCLLPLALARAPFGARHVVAGICDLERVVGCG